MSEIKQVIVVRKDLNMSIGKCAAQVAHASMKVVANTIKLGDLNFFVSDMWYWMHDSMAKIVLGVDTEKELFDIYEKVQKSTIVHALIIDVGKTEFNNIPTTTCLSIGPDYSEKIDVFTKHLKLLK